MTSPGQPEPAVLVPPRLTSSAYALLVRHGLVARRWHLQGRHGSRTYAIPDGGGGGAGAGDKGRRRMGLPLLPGAAEWLDGHRERKHGNGDGDLPPLPPDLARLMETEGVEIDPSASVPPPRSLPKTEIVDATVHPEGAALLGLPLSPAPSRPAERRFTYVELFAGIGGFGVALDAMGGRCAFASEIWADAVRVYEANAPPPDFGEVAGDIYAVRDETFAGMRGSVDLLVGGFPCQPFSRLGSQPGLAEERGRGRLFGEIVRALRTCRPRAFLLENVPGLLTMGNGTLDVILEALGGAGYNVSTEVVTARGMTAQNRKRLYFAGIRREEGDGKGGVAGKADGGPIFRFPFLPDLGLRAGDVLDHSDGGEEDGFHRKLCLSEAQMDQLLRRSKRWKPAHMAWPDTVCSTLDGHYGTSPGRGNCQLVPGKATFGAAEAEKGTSTAADAPDRLPPRNPRLMSPRECARVMGFPCRFVIPEATGGAVPAAADDDGVGERSHRKRLYLMFGNAVCPPVIAALAGAVLAEAGVGRAPPSGGTEASLSGSKRGREEGAENEREPEFGGCWRRAGLEVGIALSIESVREDRRTVVKKRLVASGIIRAAAINAKHKS